ncbi:MAG TPA: right-handed parallel beta-helix repeat-containing protein, partial [Kofleriaceae bacterium]
MSIVRPRTAAGLRIAIALSALPSCRQLNPRFCEAHPQDVDCARLAGVDAGACTGDLQCPASAPVCDLSRSRCVQCTAAELGACGGTTPVCGADETCRGCALDAECASLTCLPDQSCAPLLDVLYVSPSATDLATCMPDDHCSLTRALNLIDGTKATIRLDPAVYPLPATLTLPNDLHLVGRGAVVDRVGSGTGPVLAVPSNANIVIDDVTVQGGQGAGGFGIQCASATLTLREVTVQNNGGAGVSASSCALAISDSQISSNGGAGVSASNGMVAISHSQILNNQDLGVDQSGGSLALTRSLVRGNKSGGLLLTRATFDLENDMLVENGGPSSAIGGAAITLGTPLGNVFAFNTVAQNQTADGATPGVVCTSFVTPVAMTSSIVFGNGASVQVEGNNCVWTYSDIGPAPVQGTGNLSGDPRFVDPAHDDFHLQAASPARDAADPAATLAVDLDGDPRPQGARDMGAD